MGEGRIKRKYSIHEVAELLNISADAIRLYEKEGLVSPLRNESNGYRYYETEQIHRIMGIALYRQIGVGLSEIKKLFYVTEFPSLSAEFQALIDDNDRQIRHLQRKIEKMQFMKKHLESLQSGIGNYSVRQLPERYVLFENCLGQIQYEEMLQVLRQSYFSFGNFCYLTRTDEQYECRPEKLQFVIRDEMFPISSAVEGDTLECQPPRECLYTVCSCPELAQVHWDLSALYGYAQREGYVCSQEAYAFYVYSLMGDQDIVDFYEIYVPIL